jgi:hypothetical protein
MSIVDGRGEEEEEEEEDDDDVSGFGFGFGGTSRILILVPQILRSNRDQVLGPRE